MPKTLSQRIAGLVYGVSPRDTETSILVLTPRTDARATQIVVPHFHGRGPDRVDLVNLSSIRVILEALGVAFPTPGAGDAELLEGGTLETTALAENVYRPEGAGHVHVPNDGLSSEYIRVNSFWFPPPGGEGDLALAVISSIGQGRIDRATDDPCALLGHRIEDIVAVPDNGPAPLDVDFYPANLNTLTAQELAGVTWEWNFGDGSPVVETDFPFASHTYTVADTYTVTLTGRSTCAGEIVIEAVDLVTAT